MSLNVWTPAGHAVLEHCGIFRGRVLTGGSEPLGKGFQDDSWAPFLFMLCFLLSWGLRKCRFLAPHSCNLEPPTMGTFPSGMHWVLSNCEPQLSFLSHRCFFSGIWSTGTEKRNKDVVSFDCVERIQQVSNLKCVHSCQFPLCKCLKATSVGRDILVLIKCIFLVYLVSD